VLCTGCQPGPLLWPCTPNGDTNGAHGIRQSKNTCEWTLSELQHNASCQSNVEELVTRLKYLSAKVGLVAYHNYLAFCQEHLLLCSYKYGSSSRSTLHCCSRYSGPRQEAAPSRNVDEGHVDVSDDLGISGKAAQCRWPLQAGQHLTCVCTCGG